MVTFDPLAPTGLSSEWRPPGVTTKGIEP